MSHPFCQKLAENHELVWDDGVCAETVLDFDAQHISSGVGLAAWAGGLGFFASLLTFIKYAWVPDTCRAAVSAHANHFQICVEE